MSEHRKGRSLYSSHASPRTFWANSVKFYEDKAWIDCRSTASWKELLNNAALFVDRGEDIADLSFLLVDTIAELDEEALQHLCQEPFGPGNDDAELNIAGDKITAVDADPAPPTSIGERGAGSAMNLSTTLTDADIKPCVKAALTRKNTNSWREAMRREISRLEATGTWELVDPPSEAKLIASKFVLKIKIDAKGIPMKLEARLVAGGFSQREGIDYQETFAPVAPRTAIRTIIAIACAHKWHLHVTNFTQAFLNGTLNHVIYMKLLTRAPTPTEKTYKIVRGLYNLKQPRRLWNLELDKALRAEAFMPLSSALCVYSRTRNGRLPLVGFHLNDLLIASADLDEIQGLKT